MSLVKYAYVLPVPLQIAKDESGNVIHQRDRDGNVVLGRDGEPKPVLETVPGAPTRPAREWEWNCWLQEYDDVANRVMTQDERESAAKRAAEVIAGMGEGSNGRHSGDTKSTA